jgi:hypothetical protein
MRGLRRTQAASASSAKSRRSDRTEGKQSMNAIATKDGAELYYKDSGKGQAIVFFHVV